MLNEIIMIHKEIIMKHLGVFTYNMYIKFQTNYIWKGLEISG